VEWNYAEDAVGEAGVGKKFFSPLLDYNFPVKNSLSNAVSY